MRAAAFAFILDVGANLLTVCLAFIAGVPGIIAAYAALKGLKTSRATGLQLTNNGGSTALDKLQAGHRAINARLDDHATRLTGIEAHVNPGTSVLPPPPAGTPHL